MGGKSKIEWTDDSWNPIVGCSVVTPGCTNCYAMRQAARLERMLPPERRGDAILPNHYTALTKPSNAGPVWTGRVSLAPDRVLLAPLRRRKPTVYFVNSMGDLFHEAVPNAWIDRVFAVMALAPQHTFQILTKRSKRMREYFLGPWPNQDGVAARIADATHEFAPRREQLPQPPTVIELPIGLRMENGEPEFGFRRMLSAKAWPLPNVWLGVSAEDQARADERTPDLLATPAAVRFVSAEPLLGPLDVGRFLRCEGCGYSVADRRLHGDHNLCRNPTTTLDAVIVGGESGPRVRPMQVAWTRSIVAQCRAAGVACFVKQLGADPVWEDGAFLNLKDRKGADPAEWPEDLRVRELPWRTANA